MKTLVLGMLLLAAAATTAVGPPSLAGTIQASKWHRRVLLVAAPTATQAGFRAQKKLLSTVPTSLTERDILVLDVLYNQLLPTDQQYLQQHVKLSLQGFAVVLIGKDGSVKLRGTQPVAPAKLFGLIDRMPMRQQEMRRAQ